MAVFRKRSLSLQHYGKTIDIQHTAKTHEGGALP